MFKALCKKHKLLSTHKDDDIWIDTITSHHMCGKEYGDESIWRKTTNNHTIDLITFIHAVPVGEEKSFQPLLEYRMKYIFDACRKKKGDFTGQQVLQFVHDLPQGDTAGLGKFALVGAAVILQKLPRS